MANKKVANFHVVFSCQFRNCYRQVRFHLRLFEWRFGDESYKLSNGLILHRMYAFGPFAIQWS